VVGSLLVLLACGDSSGPANGGGVKGRIAIGDTVSASWSSDTTSYFLRPANPVTIAVYGKSTGQLFTMQLVDSATGSLLASMNVSYHSTFELADHHTRAVTLAAGQTATIRVIRSSSSAGQQYQIAVARVLVAPELLSSTLQPGDSVAGETIADPVDVDRFYLHAPPGGPLELTIFGQSLAGQIQVVASDSATGIELSSTVFDTDSTPNNLIAVRMYTFSVPPGAGIQVEVSQFGRRSGGYLLWIYPIDRAPEALSAPIALNDTLQGESLENSADIDEFTVSVAAGAELIAFYQGPGTTINDVGMRISGGGLVQPYPAVTNAPSSNLEELNTGRFIAPVGGVLTISHTGGASGGGPAFYPHPFKFMLRTINRQPEVVGSSIAIGDSVVGESIDHIGDIDEFTFMGVNGQAVTGTIRAVQGFAQVSIVLEILDAGGVVLATATSQNGIVGSTGSIILPADDTYRIRILSQHPNAGAGGFEGLLQ
jgi:hypothetical protein